jgi:hypothetical protein
MALSNLDKINNYDALLAQRDALASVARQALVFIHKHDLVGKDANAVYFALSDALSALPDSEKKGGASEEETILHRR